MLYMTVQGDRRGENRLIGCLGDRISMKIIKRSGAEVSFDLEKIIEAIRKANATVEDAEKLTEEEIDTIAEIVEDHCEQMMRSPNVEEIQDMVENQLMRFNAYNMARNYITYRYKRALIR